MKKTISYSELDTFAKCRRKWELSYREGLRSKQATEPLSVGDVCHRALMMYYLRQDWRREIRLWLEEKQVEAITNPEILSTNEQEDDDYFNETSVDLSEIAFLAEALIERYILKHGEEDKTWAILEVEKRFEIPIPGTDYLLVGVFDLIIKDERGHVFIVDHKFIGNTFRDYDSLELDTQIGIYQWAAQQLGYNALGFIYNQIKRKLPKIPTPIKTTNKLGGKVSIAEIDSDWETFEKQLVASGESHLIEHYKEEMEPKLSKKNFFQRNHIYRSQTEIDNFYTQLMYRMEEFMRVTGSISLNNPGIYMNPERFTCGYCAFKQICVETMKGNDGAVAYIKETDFERRKNESTDSRISV